MYYLVSTLCSRFRPSYSSKLWLRYVYQEYFFIDTQRHPQDIGRLRIVEIVTWPQVSPRAVMSREILSFQRGLIPLLRVSDRSCQAFVLLLISPQYMSSDFVVQSTLRTQAKYASFTRITNVTINLLLANCTRRYYRICLFLRMPSRSP